MVKIRQFSEASEDFKSLVPQDRENLWVAIISGESDIEEDFTIGLSREKVERYPQLNGDVVFIGFREAAA